MKITFHGEQPSVETSRQSSPTYAYSTRGLDLGLHVQGFPGTIKFDSPEEAEEIAGAILAGLKQNDLPRRSVPNA